MCIISCLVLGEIIFLLCKFENSSPQSQTRPKTYNIRPCYNSILLCVFADVPEGSFIVRAHTPMSNLFSCLWFNEVERFTPRDQLSFAYTYHKLRRMNPDKPFYLNMFKVRNLRSKSTCGILMVEDRYFTWRLQKAHPYLSNLHTTFEGING